MHINTQAKQYCCSVSINKVETYSFKGISNKFMVIATSYSFEYMSSIHQDLGIRQLLSIHKKSAKFFITLLLVGSSKHSNCELL